jgi:hypothetical protein
MCLSFPIFPNDLQAYGNNLIATAVMAGGLVWHILHPPQQAGADAQAPDAVAGALSAAPTGLDFNLKSQT